jgi:anti-sigma B factor antagonist
MVTTPIEASVRKTGDLAIVDLSGDINAMAESALTEAYAQASALGVERIALNFTQVGYINSTGIALIVGLLASARKEGLSLAAYGLSDHYREIFEITRLADFLTMFPDEAAATAGEGSRNSASGGEQ